MSGHLRSSLCFRYAQFLSIFGLKARAHEFLELAVEQNPLNQRAWTFLGFLNAQMERPDSAIRALERAATLSPSDADTVFNLGYVQQKAGRHREAIASFERALAVNPSLDRAWYGAGISLMREGRFPDAVEKFKEAARLQYFNPYAGYQLAAALHKLGEHEKVRVEYERVKGFDPKIAEQIRNDFGVAKD